MITDQPYDQGDDDSINQLYDAADPAQSPNQGNDPLYEYTEEQRSPALEQYEQMVEYAPPDDPMQEFLEERIEDMLTG